jgi:glycosyltransferase involved in cell wall biosynthesis
MLERRQPTVSIIIKALNEEQHVAAAIESALAALTNVDGEIILADGGSTDRTVEIGRGYPIMIVQLNRSADRSCGAGAQLGFQYSRGRYVLLIDGDMELRKGFLSAAIDVLRENPTIAGVGGHVIECEIENLEFEQRSKRHDPEQRGGPVTRLNGCGLYRRSAIEALGYVTDRNLHGAEEFDLGARLHACGWTLAKVDRLAVDHHGHTGSAYRLLLARVKTRNSFAIGELLRAAIGRPHFRFVITKDHNFMLCLLVAGWWATIVLTSFNPGGLTSVLAAGAIFLLPLVTMSVRWRSLRLGLYSVIAWNVYTLSFLPGFLRSRVPPATWIDSTILQDRTPRFDRARSARRMS